MTILIRGPAVVGRPGEELLPKADVVIEGRRFEAVVPRGGVEGKFDRVVEGEGGLLLPGLVNAHTHLAMTLLRNAAPDVPLDRWLTEHIWPRERRLRPQDAYWGTLLGLAEAIRSGTTAVADMYFHMDEVAGAVEEAGVRALLAYGIIAQTPDRVEPELGEAERFARAWDGAAEGRIRAALAPHAPSTCRAEVWKRAAALAHELKVPLHTHLAETREEGERVRAERGKSPTEWLEELGALSVPLLAAHCVHVSEKDVEILAAHGASAVHCPTSNLRLGCGIAPVAALLAGGVNVALGTDGAASAGDLNMLEEMRLASLLAGIRSGPGTLPPAAALRLATTGGAAALGLGKEAGTIEPGRRADGVLVRMDGPHFCPGGDPVADLVYGGQGLDVQAVFVDGRPLLLGGELQTLDLEKIRARCREISRRLRR
ncbi:MAG: amidohydrolase [Candidatus Bipolaricaulota bacterium]|nr:amidohydrolase [Candidatus Bipolaricaulota bacterium]